MMHPISSSATHQASLEDAGIELAELGQVALQRYATVHDSLRSPPIAHHLHLINEVPALPNAEFMTHLMNQLSSGSTTNGVGIKPAWMQFLTRHRALCSQLGSVVGVGSVIVAAFLTAQIVSLAVQMKSANNNDGSYQALEAEQNKMAAIIGGLFGTTVLSFALSVLFERATRNVVDPFLNGPNVIDQNIVDPNELNNQPQNVHAASTNRTHVAAFQALRSTIANPVDKAQTKQHILQIFDYMCEGESSDFKREMMALYQVNTDTTDADKLHVVKNKIENAVDFMLGDDQADRTPMHYPSTVTSSAVLTHVWSCIEQLSVAGYEDQARLLTENLFKALYASHGLCNTGHVSRVLQAFGDTTRFGFNQDTPAQEAPPVITPQDFYTLNQNDLNTLLNEVINTHSIRAVLHDLVAVHAEDRVSYKAAATLVVKETFISQLSHYLADHHALVLQSNPQLHEGLMRFLEVDFAAFIDNARGDEDMHSVASFSPV